MTVMSIKVTGFFTVELVPIKDTRGIDLIFTSISITYGRMDF